jgi:hypothetical protein
VNSQLDQKGALSTALHELGHQAEFQMFVHAPADQQKEVLQAWQKQMKETPVGKLTVEQHRPLTAEKYGEQARGEIPPTGFEKNYLRNFSEWYAEQTSRWITQTKEPTNTVDKFFKKVADTWKKIYERVTGYLPLREEVDKFYRSQWKGDTLSELFTPKVAAEGQSAGAVGPEGVKASIDGRELQRLRKSINDVARNHNDGLVRNAAREYVASIDNMLGSELQPRLKETNSKYAATMALEDGIAKGFVSGGKIDPKALGEYLKYEKNHPLYPLGYAGRELNFVSRKTGEQLPQYDLTGALLGRAKQLIGSVAGTRSQYARGLQRGLLSPAELEGVPQPEVPKGTPVTGLSALEVQRERERKRKLAQALRTNM